MSDPARPGSDQSLLLRALELPAEERAAFVEEAAAGDEPLRRRVERLLAAHERAAHLTGAEPALELGRSMGGVGDRLGPYVLLETLGEGGMGTVYLAQQEEPIRRQVALKVIRLGRDTEQVVARFEAERQTLALMDHPGIARVFDAGATEEGRPYFVMELVRGTTITEYCDREGLDTEARLELFLQTGAAVQHAHQRGIIHRDIKPSNVLVTEGETPQPKVIDFGIAKATATAEVEGAELLTVQAQILGTPEYMSPEQATGSADIDTRTDVYSLGVLLYELLTGSRPLVLDEVYPQGLAAVLEHIAKAEPEKPSTNVGRETAEAEERAGRRGRRPAQLARQIRGDLDWIVLKALEKDSARRYESASALAADIRRYLRQMPVEAGPPSALYVAVKFASRHRLALGAAAAVLLALFGGLASLAWSLEQVKDERDNVLLAQEGEREALQAVQEALVDLEEERDRAESARARAEDDRDEALAISDFFTTMIKSADARREGRDVLVRTILHQAENRLERDFTDRPAVQARIGGALGSSFMSLGEYERSQELLERSARTHHELFGRDDPETILADSQLGVSLIHRGDLQRARDLLEDVVERASSVHGPHDAITLRTRGNLAIVHQNLADFRFAEAFYREVVDDCEEHLGLEHPVSLHVRIELVRLYTLNRRAAQAEALLDETLAGLGSSPARDDPAALRMQTMMADLLHWHGDLAGAVELGRENLAGHERVFGPEHPKTHEAMHGLAVFLEVNGEYEEALALTERVIPLHRDLLGPVHTSTLATERLQGLILWKLSRLDEAEQVLRETRERFLRTMGEEHSSSQDITNLLAIVCFAQSHFHEAVEMWTAQFDSIVASQGEDSLATITPRANLGMVYSSLGRFDEAEEYLEYGLELCLEAYGPTSDWTLRIQNNLAELYRSQGDFEAAVELNGEVLERRRRQFGERHPDTLGSLVNHGHFLMLGGNPEEAFEVLDEASSLCVEELGEENALTLNAMMRLGETASELGDHEAALEHLLFSHEQAVEVLGRDHGQTLRTQLALARAAHATEDPEEARRLIEDALETGAERIAAGSLQISDALELLARIRSEQGDAAGAAEAYALHRERVLGRAAAEGASWVSLQQAAELLLDTEDEEDAAQALSIAQQLIDQQSVLRPEHQHLLARCLLACGEAGEARRVLEAALAEMPRDHALRGELQTTLASVPVDG